MAGKLIYIILANVCSSWSRLYLCARFGSPPRV